MITSLLIRREVQYLFSHKSSIISTWYANLYSNYNRIMSELIAMCIFLYVRRTTSQPDFFAIKTALKITKLKIYFIKKEQLNFPTVFKSKTIKIPLFNHIRQTGIRQNGLSKLGIGKVGFGKLVLSRRRTTDTFRLIIKALFSLWLR